MAFLDNQTPAQYYGNADNFGNYQFLTLDNIINQFMFAYVGEDKIISKASRTDVAFHAQRGLAELSFDTLKSTKALEIEVPSTLQMILPQDYVGYIKLSWVDSAGIKHILQPASKTSNPIKPTQDADGDYTFVGAGGAMITEDESTAWENYKSQTPSENNINDYQDYQNETYWPLNGSRYGLDPQHAQTNGSFYIDENTGNIHFSSNISGKTIILDYISDSLGTENQMQVHKFAEEAMYKWITHAVISTSSYGQALVPRLTKDKFAAVRKAKLRLSNIKLEELTQVLRGKSKQIKH